ncbi:M4 family metallopeptidase [Pleionea sp. CnH1-48]|uniref:M4 family metallopeptidase n=1 Tax=Pleionea sp. CnH1-48 TaxID=2954494 RepID=UPI002098024D|nr:M4 family metallopeptidase [Pleionea sp. CnH1-48]MCO7223878.1 M4 family metallopeptidase [Pleionea sp. CnH1-48]
MKIRSLKWFTAASLAVASISSLFAAEKVNLRQQLTASTQTLQAQSLQPLSDQQLLAHWTQENGHSLQAIRTTTDSQGREFKRYRQLFQGVPIWGEQIIIARTNTQEIHRLSGHVISDLADSLTQLNATFSKKRAVNLARSQHILSHDEHAAYSNEQSELVIYIDDGGAAQLAWSVNFFAESPNGGEPTRPFFLINARNGQIIKQWEGLAHQDATGPGGNQKTGQYEYGTDFPAMEVDSNCRMNTTNVQTQDMNHSTFGGSVHQFTCPRNTHKAINGAFAPLNDAHYFGGVVFSLYSDWLNTSPLTQQLLLRVHYSNNYENAFWNGSSMTFGDGQNTFHPLVSLDVVAHEVSHGFTEQNSNLTYSGQSGGINEAFSDIAGEAAEFFMTGQNDFLVGAQIIKAANQALRYMHNPPLDGKSIGHASDYTSGMNVHYSSGVFNKAFYLIASSNNWNVRKAFEIFARANQNYWTSSTNFVEGACGVLDATSDLGYDAATVVDAFNQVGVVCPNSGPQAPTANFSHQASGADPLSIQFTDTSSDTDGNVVSWSWNFGDGNTSASQNPSNLYANAGNYSVSLTVTDNDGLTNTKTESISVGGATGNGELTKGVPETGLSAAQGEELRYYIDVPAGASNLTFDISGGSGDADIYVRFGSEPTTSQYDCRPYRWGNSENCTFSTAQEGRYHVMIRAYSTFSNLQLVANYDEGSSGSEFTETNVSAAQGEWQHYTIQVGANFSELLAEISGGSGDADLYVRFGAQPTTSQYDCRPYRWGNAETCTINNPQAGTWHISVRAYSAFSGLTVHGKATP